MKGIYASEEGEHGHLVLGSAEVGLSILAESWVIFGKGKMSCAV